MASYTPNLNLVLPIGVEKVSRAIVNSNNTIIDGAIGGINTKITPVSLGASTLAGVKTALINLNSGMTNYTDRAVYFALSSTDGVFTANVPYIGVLHRQDANNFSCNVQGKSGQNITLGYDNGTWTIDSPKDEVATLNSKLSYHVSDVYKTGNVFFGGRTSGGTNNGVYFSLMLDKPIGDDVSNISITFGSNDIIRLWFGSTLVTYTGRTATSNFKKNTNIVTVYLSGVEIAQKDNACTVEISALGNDNAIELTFS